LALKLDKTLKSSMICLFSVILIDFISTHGVFFVSPSDALYVNWNIFVRDFRESTDSSNPLDERQSETVHPNLEKLLFWSDYYDTGISDAPKNIVKTSQTNTGEYTFKTALYKFKIRIITSQGNHFMKPIKLSVPCNKNEKTWADFVFDNQNIMSYNQEKIIQKESKIFCNNHYSQRYVVNLNERFNYYFMRWIKFDDFTKKFKEAFKKNLCWGANKLEFGKVKKYIPGIGEGSLHGARTERKHTIKFEDKERSSTIVSCDDTKSELITLKYKQWVMAGLGNTEAISPISILSKCLHKGLKFTTEKNEINTILSSVKSQFSDGCDAHKDLQIELIKSLLMAYVDTADIPALHAYSAGRKDETYTYKDKSSVIHETRDYNTEHEQNLNIDRRNKESDSAILQELRMLFNGVEERLSVVEKLMAATMKEKEFIQDNDQDDDYMEFSGPNSKLHFLGEKS